MELFGTAIEEPAAEEENQLDKEIVALQEMILEAENYIKDESSDDIKRQHYKKVKETCDKRLAELWKEAGKEGPPDAWTPDHTHYNALMERAEAIGKAQWLQNVIPAYVEITKIEGKAIKLSNWNATNYNFTAQALAKMELEHSQEQAEKKKTKSRKKEAAPEQKTDDYFKVGDWVTVDETRYEIIGLGENEPTALLLEEGDTSRGAPDWYKFTEMKLINPQEVYDQIVEWAKENGKDSTWVFGYMGPIRHAMGKELTIPVCDALATKLYEVLQNGTAADSTDTADAPPTIAEDAPIAAEAATPTATTATTEPSTTASAAPSEPDLRRTYNPEGHQIDPETGEVLDLPWVLKIVGMSEMPTELNEEQITKIGDKISTYRQRAEKYREQAERLAKPMEQRAAAMEQFFGDLIDAYVIPRLPRFGPKAKNPGAISKKTLDLLTCSISYEKTGGPEIEDYTAYEKWKNGLSEDDFKIMGGKIERKLGKAQVDKLLLEQQVRIPGCVVRPANETGYRKPIK